MSANPLRKIDRFLVMIGISSIIAALIVAFTTRIFLNALNISREIDETALSQITQLNIIQLNEAVSALINQNNK